jgi:type 2 lantibiotic biosynthesis protein LanM
MQLSESELRDIAARAMPLSERWHVCIETPTNDSKKVDRIQNWRRAFSLEGDPDLLSRRLKFDGLDWDTCCARLGSVRLFDDQPLPDWAALFGRLIERYDPQEEATAAAITYAQNAVAADTSSITGADSGNVSLPFDEVWIPFVRVAADDLRSRAGKSLGQLGEDVIRCFQQSLLDNLAQLAALSLGLEFRRFVCKHDPLSVFQQPAIGMTSPPRELYRRFVRNLCNGGLVVFFQEYPVLARLMTVATNQWVGHLAEFCRRLGDDRPALAALFNCGMDPGIVVDVNTGVSDSHHGGRSVVIATFASGLRVVYKPKDLGIDEAYSALIEWLNRRIDLVSTSEPSKFDGLSTELPPLRTVKVLNCTTHGWVEFFGQQPCRDARQLELYFQRVGMFLCLTCTLGGTDFHLDNVIAGGEHPVLVDLETMLQPLPIPWDSRLRESADLRAAEVMHQSVLRTGLLPFWINGAPGKTYDVSGIGAAEIADTGYLSIQWDAINTDAMQLAYRNAETKQETNRPTLAGQIISAEDHLDEMIDGFVGMYQLLVESREELLANDGPLAAFRGLSLRYLLRMTKTYGQIAERRLHPEFLRDGADSSIELERLMRDFVVLPPDPHSPPPWGICGAELRAIERLDIPYFSFMSDSKSLLADGQVVARGFFSQSGIEYVENRLRKMGDDDLQQQLRFIRASLHARFADPLSENKSLPGTRANTPPSEFNETLSRAELIASTVRIAQEIRNTALRGGDGSSTWISLAFDPVSDRMRLLPMSDSLYDGRVGVALFLAALEHVTGGAGFRDLALSAVLPLRQALRHPSPPAIARNMLGAATGLGSQIYALTRIANWLADDELRDLAARAATWFIPQRIGLDDSLDIFGGAAGGIVGLLALCNCGGNSAALSAAAECGEHLLGRRVTTRTGHRAWPSSWLPQPLTGFSHGAAGIAYALLRLSHATGDSRFRDAAEEAIAFETTMYSSSARNWPDLRLPTEAGQAWFMVAWCNGAPGIGLGRLGGLSQLDNASIRDDIDHALQTTRETPIDDADHLCCGSTGRIDFLLEAGKRLHQPKLVDEARQRGSTIVRQASKRGGFQVYAQAPGFSASTSFFQGIAGIGYQLLRLADPGSLPCALLWE